MGVFQVEMTLNDEFEEWTAAEIDRRLRDTLDNLIAIEDIWVWEAKDDDDSHR